MEKSAAEYQRGGFMTELPPVPEDEFCVFGTVYAHPEHADALEAVYAQTTKSAASEPGIIYYCLARDPDDRNVFHFFERYTGRKAFEEHNNTPTVKMLIADGLMRGVKAKFVKAIEPPSQQLA
ncbi:Putative antibiotic biosynthesis monooxygenase domain-containing protein [Septoria linicola]|uniref:Antibiotic biosynthesis monooxygenase domain-containing protein n=1 Tax=Septoria linicola TaxID=215465 RepID=A0A9Q9AMI5_9PEZI|nr:putative antibiotic biosynthesis monooxygenase domain-containing protein [Septoria linicola]USW48838.1 Putative antibiotic biosynthesis monooxygenase domain-containing protein [Septoria linicola]